MGYCLAIDTSGNWCSVGLVTDCGKQRYVAQKLLKRGHAEHILHFIDDVFTQAGFETSYIGFTHLSRIAVLTGPGSFTGLRVGLSVARGIALAQSIPCIGINSLEAFAVSGYNRLKCQGLQADHLHAVIQGRGGQIFCQKYMLAEQDSITPISDAQNVFPTELGNSPKGFFAGSGEALIDQAEETQKLGVDYCSMDQIAIYAMQRDPNSYLPEPHYLRDADAVPAKSVFPMSPEAIG